MQGVRGGGGGGREGDWAGGAHPHPPPPRDDLRFSHTTSILQKKKKWSIDLEVGQETSAPPPKKIPDPPLKLHARVTHHPQEPSRQESSKDLF